LDEQRTRGVEKAAAGWHRRRKRREGTEDGSGGMAQEKEATGWHRRRKRRDGTGEGSDGMAQEMNWSYEIAAGESVRLDEFNSRQF